MSYSFEPNLMYRMPTHFGPSTGPRRGPNGETFDGVDDRKSIEVSVSFRTNPEQLAAMLPPRFELGDEPIATVFATYMTEIAWLAGRGYAVLGMNFPVIYRGEQETVRGPLLTVLWENLTDPIITGREELGFSKIYCKLPNPRITSDSVACSASWLDSQIMDLRIENLEKAEKSGSDVPAAKVDGLLHYKYMPRTGEWGTADSQYAVISPADGPTGQIIEQFTGDGFVEWKRSTWKDLPTQYMIVNSLADLEIREYTAASLTRSIGAGSLSNQRIVR
jgi:hypothetical protein